MRNLLKLIAIGAVVYGAYKLGERQGQKTLIDRNDKDFLDSIDESLQEGTQLVNSEIEYVKNLIETIKRKPNKNSRDRNTLDLLKIKLEQLIQQS